MILDHYKILGVDPDASIEEIKKAYRKIAVKNHPDKAGGDNTVFLEATKSYEILKDPLKRKSYNDTLKKLRVTSEKRIRKGPNLRVSLNLTVEDLFKGNTRKFATTRKALCPQCGGSGLKNRSLPVCQTCRGSGIDLVSSVLGPKKYCHMCRGYGNIVVEGLPCPECKGTGTYKERIQRSIRLNPLIRREIILPKAGNFCKGGEEAGDLIVELNVQKTPGYLLDGLDIKKTLTISPAQAVLGDVVTLNFSGEKKRITIPPGIHHGAVIENQKGGFQWGTRTGSLTIRVLIAVPQINNLSKKEITLYSQLLSLEKSCLIPEPN